jgi:hypothetical protein
MKALMTKNYGGDTNEKLKKIKIVENKEDSQENIDNHPSQNYNVEHFCICTHGEILRLQKSNENLNTMKF